MDNRMQQCPNCGSAVLPSARFCVTCGIRLPEPAGEATPVEPANWSRPAEDVWIGEAPAVDGEDVIAMPPSEGTAPIQEEQAGEAPDAHSRQSEDVSAGDAEDGDAVVAPTDHAEHLPGEASDSSDPSEARPEMNGELVGPEGELAPAAAPVYPESQGSSGFETDDTMLETGGTATLEPDEMSGEEAEETDDFDPAGWDDVDDGPNEAGESETSESIGYSETVTAGMSTGESDSATRSDHAAAIMRAEALIEELRQILPLLSTPAASEPALDRAALREQALATSGERSFDDFASLRAVIHDAVHRPKDIEVVLRLSQHANDMEALLNERDRLQTALDDLLRELGE